VDKRGPDLTGPEFPSDIVESTMNKLLFTLLAGCFATASFAQVASPSTAVNPNTNPAAVGVPTTPPTRAQMAGEERKEQRMSDSSRPVPRTANTSTNIDPQTNPAAVGVPSNPPTRAQVSGERKKSDRMASQSKQKTKRNGTKAAAEQKNLQGG
jgi:hypothetical protein